MINLDQKYESYVRSGTKKLRIDGIQERVRGYGYTDESVRRISSERAQELMNVVIKSYPQLPLEKLRQELDYLRKIQ